MTGLPGAVISHQGADRVEVDADTVEKPKQCRLHDRTKVGDAVGDAHVDARFHQAQRNVRRNPPVHRIRFGSSIDQRIGASFVGGSAAELMGIRQSRNLPREPGNFRGGFGCDIETFAKQGMAADLGDWERRVGGGQNKPDCSRDKSTSPVDQQAVNRMRIVAVGFAFIRMFGRILECVFDAIHVVSKPIAFVEALRCVRRDNFKMPVIRLDE